MIAVDELEVKLVETALKSEQVKIKTVSGRTGWHVSMPDWDAPIHVWYGHPCWEECTNVWQARVDAAKREMLDRLHGKPKPGRDWERFKILATLSSISTVIFVYLAMFAGLYKQPLWKLVAVSFVIGVGCAGLVSLFSKMLLKGK